MKVLGQCEFALGMSEWTGTVCTTVLDLEADFDSVLAMSWHLQWKPLYDWETLDIFVNTPEGVQRVVHKLSIGDVRMPDMQRLTMLDDWHAELRASGISLTLLPAGIRTYFETLYMGVWARPERTPERNSYP
jgi:hypothetical protein